MSKRGMLPKFRPAALGREGGARPTIRPVRPSQPSQSQLPPAPPPLLARPPAAPRRHASDFRATTPVPTPPPTGAWSRSEPDDDDGELLTTAFFEPEIAVRRADARRAEDSLYDALPSLEPKSERDPYRDAYEAEFGDEPQTMFAKVDALPHGNAFASGFPKSEVAPVTEPSDGAPTLGNFGRNVEACEIAIDEDDPRTEREGSGPRVRPQEDLAEVALIPPRVREESVDLPLIAVDPADAESPVTRADRPFGNTPPPAFVMGVQPIRHADGFPMHAAPSPVIPPAPLTQPLDGVSSSPFAHRAPNAAYAPAGHAPMHPQLLMQPPTPPPLAAYPAPFGPAGQGQAGFSGGFPMQSAASGAHGAMPYGAMGPMMTGSVGPLTTAQVDALVEPPRRAPRMPWFVLGAVFGICFAFFATGYIPKIGQPDPAPKPAVAAAQPGAQAPAAHPSAAGSSAAVAPANPALASTALTAPPAVAPAVLSASTAPTPAASAVAKAEPARAAAPVATTATAPAQPSPVARRPASGAPGAKSSDDAPSAPTPIAKGAAAPADPSPGDLFGAALKP